MKNLAFFMKIYRYSLHTSGNRQFAPKYYFSIYHNSFWDLEIFFSFPNNFWKIRIVQQKAQNSDISKWKYVILIYSRLTVNLPQQKRNGSSQKHVFRAPKCQQTNETSPRHVFHTSYFFPSASHALCFMKHCYHKRNLEGIRVFVLEQF